MKIKNKKGFTLPELLAAVVIIGILSTIAVVSVNNVMKKSHKEYDIKQNKLFTTAAQTYFTDNRSKLPRKLLTEKEVTLSELIKENYIEEIVDYKKELYNQEESKAYVKKMGRGKYSYYSKLVGSDGRVISDKEASKKSGDINVSINDYNIRETDMPRTISKDIYYVNKILKIDISGRSTGEGISSYQYKIERLKNERDKTGKKYKSSGEIEVDNKAFTDTITINAKDFANGVYKLVVYAYDYEGATSNSKESKIIVIDKTKPKCTIKMSRAPDGLEVENAKPANKWYKAGDLTALMNITETNKYKYAIGLDEQTTNITYDKNNTKDKEEYPIENNVVGKYVYGYIQDKAGNIGKCQTDKPVYYDKTKPNCNISKDRNPEGGDNGWYWDRDIQLKQNSFDNEKGLNESGVRDQYLTDISYEFPTSVSKKHIENITSYQQKETKGTTWYGHVRDKAGNLNICSTSVKLEKSNPECKINYDKSYSILNGQSTGWFNQPVNASVEFKNSPTISGKATTKIKYQDWPNDQTTDSKILLGNGTNQFVYGILVDNAGKTASCYDWAKVDTAKPECVIKKNGCDTEGPTTYYKGKTYCGSFGYQYEVSCKEQNGSNCYYLAYLHTTGATGAENKFRNDYPDIYAHGYSTAQYEVFDNAGNSTLCTKAHIYIDTHVPRIYYDTNGHSGFNNNGSHNEMPRKVYCEDDDTGVNTDTFDADFERNQMFVPGEGTEKRVNRRWTTAGGRAVMSYHYLTNGDKHTKFECEDKLGNLASTYVDASSIYCRCRASRDFGCTTKDGKTTCKYNTGDVVYGKTDKCTNGTTWCNCGNQHTKNGITFNLGKSDGSGTDMYLSCATS